VISPSSITTPTKWQPPPPSSWGKRKEGKSTRVLLNPLRYEWGENGFKNLCGVFSFFSSLFLSIGGEVIVIVIIIIKQDIILKWISVINSPPRIIKIRPLPLFFLFWVFQGSVVLVCAASDLFGDSTTSYYYYCYYPSHLLPTTWIVKVAALQVTSSPPPPPPYQPRGP